MVLATENATTVLSYGIDTAITVTDLTSGSDESLDATFYMATIDQDSDGIPFGVSCTGSAIVSTTVVAPTFTAPSATVSSCILRGPNNYDATLTIIATIRISVP